MVSCGNQNPPEGFLILTLLKQKVESHSSVKEIGKAEAKKTKVYEKKEFSFSSVQF